jgi:hypothetical protein
VLRWLTLVLTVVLGHVAPTITAKEAEKEARTLQRQYTDLAVLHYLMTGNNDGWQYSIQDTDVVKRDTCLLRRFMFNYLRSGCKSQHRLSPATSSKFPSRMALLRS